MSYVKNTQDWKGHVPILIPSGDWYLKAKMYPNQYNVVDDKVVEVKTVVVYRFTIPDCEDPEIFVAEPIWEWQQTDAGKWIMEHAVEQPIWQRVHEPITYTTRYAIVARLTAKDYTFWTLKWGSDLR